MKVKVTRKQIENGTFEHEFRDGKFYAYIPDEIEVEATPIPDTECEHKMTIGLSVPEYCMKCNFIPDTEECSCAWTMTTQTEHSKDCKQKESPKCDHLELRPKNEAVYKGQVFCMDCLSKK